MGKWIAAARKAKEWTQQDLADQLGVTKANVSHWENDKHEASFGQLVRIANATGYSLDLLVGSSSSLLAQEDASIYASLSAPQQEAVRAGLHALIVALSASAATTKEAPTRVSETPRHGKGTGTDG